MRQRTGIPVSALARALPGVAAACVLALAAAWLEPPLAQALRGWTGAPVAIPAIVLALIIGMLLHPLLPAATLQPGLGFCVKTLLRVAIALLGARVALGDIWAIGPAAIALTTLAMALTLASGVWLARRLGQSDVFGAIAGGATAVCGASAALATASVLPESRDKEMETIVVVIAVNALSTVAMVAYPPLCAWLGLDERLTGIVLGATIHDVAQVVGAGYAVSETAGNTAVIVKLFRVLMLLPVILAVGWWFSGRSHGGARVPVPFFALAFFLLVLANSAGLVPEPVRLAFAEVARWGLLVAIAALGLQTSFALLRRVGLRRLLVSLGTTAVILVAVIVPALLLR